MDKIDIYEIIGNIISLINSETFESTIPNLSASCHIPVLYTRKCILTMFNNQILAFCIDSNDYVNSADPESSFIEDFLSNKTEYSLKLLNGDFDHLHWTIDLKVLDSEENELLPLTSMEYGALQSLGETALTIKRNSIFEKKDNISPISKQIRKNQITIQNAIINKYAVAFNYKNALGEMKPYICFPTYMYTNVSDNWIYFNTTDGFPFRLDRITSLCKTLKNHGEFPEIEPNPYRENIWGAYYKKGDTPVHVKIRIRPETATIIDKITADTKHRKHMCRLYKKGEFYYYEDDIIGLGEFQRWLRSYGSSIQVIEPKELRNNIIDAAQKTLEFYNISDSWDI